DGSTDFVATGRTQRERRRAGRVKGRPVNPARRVRALWRVTQERRSASSLTWSPLREVGRSVQSNRARTCSAGPLAFDYSADFVAALPSPRAPPYRSIF